MGEIAENCAGVKLVLVALKCDLREKHSDDDDADADDDDDDDDKAQGATAIENGNTGAGEAATTTTTAGSKKRQAARECIDYKQGLEVARRIQALRYLGM